MTRYALLVIRYTKPLDEVALSTADHRRYLGSLQARGIVLASGPFDPRTGGAVLLRLGPNDTLEAIRDDDPYWQRNLADYDLFEWAPTLGRDALDTL